MITPMLQALRAELPRSHVTVVAGSAAAGDVIRDSDLCDEVRAFSFRESSALGILIFFVRLRFEGFDVGIVASRLSPKIAFLLRFLSGLKVVAGDGVGRKGYGYTHWRLAKPPNHRSSDNINILRLLYPQAGIDKDLPVRFQLDQFSEPEVAAEWRLRELEGYTVLGLHPGCGLYEQDKKLPEEWSWEVISKFLSDFPEGKVALFFGPEDSSFRIAPQEFSTRIVRFQGMSLRVVAALIARTNVFICGDTGLGHVATAVGVPVVTVAGPTRIDQTRPLGGKTLIVKTELSLPCMPCFETSLFLKCPISQKCMTTVSVQKASDAIARLLKVVEA